MRSDNMPREADIVERLHEFADRMTARRYPGNADFIRAVAEEIERLRSIERENDGVIAVWRRRCNEAEDERDKLHKDVAQLRDLLADLELTREGSKVAHAELRALKAKIEAAPVEEVYNAGSEKNWYIVHAPEELDGKRVRLVVEEG